MNEIDRIEQEFTVLGNSETTSLATGAVAELLKAAGQLGAGVQKTKEDAAKSKEQQAKIAKAQAARLEATIAQNKALSEANPAGPLHEDALRKDALARQLEAEAGVTSLTSYGASPVVSSGSWFSKMSGPLSNGAWVGIGVGGVALLGLTIYFAKRK